MGLWQVHPRQQQARRVENSSQARGGGQGMMEGDNHMEETWAARSWTALRTLLCQRVPYVSLGLQPLWLLSMSTQEVLPLPILCLAAGCPYFSAGLPERAYLLSPL